MPINDSSEIIKASKIRLFDKMVRQSLINSIVTKSDNVSMNTWLLESIYEIGLFDIS